MRNWRKKTTPGKYYRPQGFSKEAVAPKAPTQSAPRGAQR